MKQLLFLSILFIFSISNLQAQVSMGLSGGINYHPTTHENSDALIFYYVEFRPTYQFSDKFSIGLGVQYSAKSYDIDTEVFQRFPPAIRHNYFDILPQIEYRPIKALGLVTGINLGYPLSSQIRVNNTDWEPSAKVRNAFSHLDVGVLIGFRVYIKQFYLTAHYNHGLKDDTIIIFTDANGARLTNQSLQTFQVGIGYLLDL